MRKILVVLTLAAAFAPDAKAEEPDIVVPRWLSAVGEFIQSEIEPPRLAEELLREEEEDRLANIRRSDPVDEVPPPPSLEPGPEPELAPEPAVYSPPEPDWEASPLPAATAAPASLLGPQPIVEQPVVEPPPALPLPTLTQQPKPGPAAPGLPAFPEAQPISPADRIAGTATLDQALKLGGPAELYAKPLRTPSPAIPSPIAGN